jgi:hypothetical protein
LVWIILFNKISNHLIFFLIQLFYLCRGHKDNSYS